jgi:hypothetical protein
MRVTGRVTGLDPIRRQIAAFPKEVQRPMDKLLIQEVRTLAVESARLTLPFGLSDGTFKKLANRIKSDISRVFKRADKLGDAYKQLEAADPALARQYWQAAKSGDEATAGRLLRKLAAKAQIPVGAIRPDLHKAARTARYGRVPDSAKTLAIISKGEALERYIAKVQRQIGSVKAGWIAAAKALGGTVRGIPRWANTGAHKKSQGRAEVQRGEKGATIGLYNIVSYAPEACDDRQLRQAERRARVRLQKAMAEKLKAIAARAFRQRG